MIEQYAYGKGVKDIEKQYIKEYGNKYSYIKAKAKRTKMGEFIVYGTPKED